VRGTRVLSAPSIHIPLGPGPPGLDAIGVSRRKWVMPSYSEFGARRIGYLYARYDELVMAFGAPTAPDHLSHALVQWCVRTPHGVATIYDDVRGHDVEVGDVHSWHVGGYNTQTYDWIKRTLRSALKDRS
jgi:hypothetical protein